MNIFYIVIFLVYLIFDGLMVSNYNKKIKKLTDENKELRKQIEKVEE